MADSTTPVPQLASGQSQKEVTANSNFDMASPAMLYGRNPSTTTGLTWGYLGGRLDSTLIASGTVALTDNATNYVVALISTGAVSVSTATTNWNATSSYLRLYKVTTVSGAVTAYEDHRSVLGLPPTVGFTGGTLTTSLNEAPITTLASAATTDIGAEAANTINVTGTTTITALGTIASGARRTVIFAGVLTLTHNGTSLILPTAANITTAAGDVAEFVSEGSGNWRCTNYERKDGSALYSAPGTVAREWQIACSDLTTAITTGTSKGYGRAPRAMTITGVRASLLTTQTSGSIFTVDINDGGTTILSTKLTIDNTEKTSTTAATPAVVSDSSIADDAEITVDVDQVGDGTAKGLVVTILYT
jgi:hypothetical protein